MALNPKLLEKNKSDWFSYGFLFTDFNDLKCTPLEQKILDIRLKNGMGMVMQLDKVCYCMFLFFFWLGSAQNTIAVYYLLRN